MTVKLPLKYMDLEIGDLVAFDELLGGIKPFGINYINENYERVNMQDVYNKFFIIKTKKSLDMVEIQCVQMHRLSEARLTGCMDDGNQSWSPNPGSPACNYDPSYIINAINTCRYEYDCNGVCDGDAIIDCCGDCTGGDTGLPTVECDTCGDCPGEGLEFDLCGVCGGDDSSCEDCAGIPNGDAIINNCGDCVIEGDSIDALCVQECDGNWYNDGSGPIVDECGVCNGDNSSCVECLGDTVTLWGVEYDIATTTYIGLNNAGLTGEIPKEIGCLTNLTQLWLYNNDLSGTIPASIGLLTNLTFLILSNNQLTGSIPVEIGNLINLTDLGLNDNNLTGSIPHTIGNMASLVNL